MAFRRDLAFMVSGIVLAACQANNPNGGNSVPPQADAPLAMMGGIATTGGGSSGSTGTTGGTAVPPEAWDGLYVGPLIVDFEDLATDSPHSVLDTCSGSVEIAVTGEFWTGVGICTFEGALAADVGVLAFEFEGRDDHGAGGIDVGTITTITADGTSYTHDLNGTIGPDADGWHQLGDWYPDFEDVEGGNVIPGTYAVGSYDAAQEL